MYAAPRVGSLERIDARAGGCARRGPAGGDLGVTGLAWVFEQHAVSAVVGSTLLMVSALVRSVSGANYRITHAGATSLRSGRRPSFMPLLAARKYFDYHHTAADTLDKVDPDNLRRHVAVMASTAWLLANMDTLIRRAPVQLP